MHDTPQISVLMPAYNAGKYVERSIRSILDQTFVDFELIIGDDGSTDNTVAIINSIDDDRIKLFSNEKNMGIVYTRNKLFNLAASNYLAIMDSDDISCPERLKYQYDFFEAHPEYALCGTWASVIDANDRTRKNWQFRKDDQEIKTEFLFGPHMVTSSVMINKKSVPIKLLFDNDYPVSEDFHLWARIAEAKGKLYIIPKELTKYRGHEEGISKTQRQLILYKIFTVVMWQLGNFIDPISDYERSIHYSVSNNTSENADFTNGELQAWINKVIQSNNITGYVDRELLVQRIYDHTYEYLIEHESFLNVLKVILGFKHLSVARRWYFIKSLIKGNSTGK